MAIGDFLTNLFNSFIDWIVEGINSISSGLAEYLGSWLIARGFSAAIPEEIFSILNELTLGIGYILPINLLIPIVVSWLSFYFLKIIFAVYSLIANTIIKRVSVKV